MRKAFLLCALFLVALPSRSQDPLKVDPAHFKVEFENSEVKVVRVHFEPHYKSVMNQVPARVVVVLRDEHFRVTYPDGSSEERFLKAGTTFWDKGGGKGIPENIGDEPFELIWVIPKRASKTH